MSSFSLSRCLLLLAAALCFGLCSDAQTCPTGYSRVIATKLGALTPLQAGLMTVTAIGADQNAITFSVPGYGVELTIPKRRSVVTGALAGDTLCLPRTDRASITVAYHFVVRDSSSAGANRIVLDVTNVAITADTFDLDDYDFHTNPSGFTLGNLVLLPVSTGPDQVLMVLPGGSYTWVSVPDCEGTTHALNYSTSSHTFSCITFVAGGGSSSTSILIDTVSGQHFELGVSSGHAILTATSATSGSNAVEMIDTVSGTHFNLTATNSHLTLSAVSSPGTGHTSIAIAGSGNSISITNSHITIN